ncbi:MAG: hypothetical protein ACOZEN_01560 [Thermodesulfobacteriota bacterium]
MSSVNVLSQDATSYFQDIIQARKKRQDERIDDGVESGTLSRANKERLEKLKEKSDALVEKALEDDKISRDEYTRLMKALDEQNKLIDKFVKDKDSAKSKTSDARVMQNQEQILNILYGRMDNIEAKIKAGVESGKIDAEEKAKLEESLAKTRDLLDKAMEDGSITKGELSEISKSQNILNRYAISYGRNRRYSGLTSRYSHSGDSAMDVQA